MDSRVLEILDNGWKVGDSRANLLRASACSYDAGALSEGAFLNVIADSKLREGKLLASFEVIPESTETYGGIRLTYQDGTSEKLMLWEQTVLSALSLLEDMLPK